MGRLAVYVETSVWSFAFAEDAPDYRSDTLVFFERCRERRIDAFVSAVVLEEIGRADAPLRTKLMRLVGEIRPVVLPMTGDVQKLTAAFLRERAVPANKPEDARHVALAFVGGWMFWFLGTSDILRACDERTGSTPLPRWKDSTNRSELLVRPR